MPIRVSGWIRFGIRALFFFRHPRSDRLLFCYLDEPWGYMLSNLSQWASRTPWVLESWHIAPSRTRVRTSQCPVVESMSPELLVRPCLCVREYFWSKRQFLETCFFLFHVSSTCHTLQSISLRWGKGDSRQRQKLSRVNQPLDNWLSNFKRMLTSWWCKISRIPLLTASLHFALKFAIN